MEKLIITCCLTGAEVTKAQNPAVPYTPEEMAQSAYEAYKAGASILHLHVREDDGTPTQSKERFKQNIDAIRAKCPDAIIQVSTGGAVGMSDEERTQPVELYPECRSVLEEAVKRRLPVKFEGEIRRRYRNTATLGNLLHEVNNNLIMTRIDPGFPRLANMVNDTGKKAVHQGLLSEDEARSCIENARSALELLLHG
jgi:hypothetical protein